MFTSSLLLIGFNPEESLGFREASYDHLQLHCFLGLYYDNDGDERPMQKSHLSCIFGETLLSTDIFSRVSVFTHFHSHRGMNLSRGLLLWMNLGGTSFQFPSAAKESF